MEDRLQAIEQKLDLLSARIEKIESRLALGAGPIWPATPAADSTEPDLSEELAPTRAALARWIPLVGRTCLVLGGAFLIRALSEGGALKLGVGIALGLALAAASISFSHRASASGRRTSAQFHAIAGALIGYPLALETATRLGAMPPAAATAVVGALTALLFLLALREHLASLAWVGTLGCLASGVVLMTATDARQELTLLILLLAAGALWLSEIRSWKALRWLPMLAMDIVVLRGVFTAAQESGSNHGPLALALVFCGAATALSLAWLSYRTFVRAAALGAFDVVQTIAGVGIGLIATAYLGPKFGWGTSVAGAFAFLLSAAAWVVATFAIPKERKGIDFLFYSGAAVALIFAGGALVIPPGFRGLLWGVIGWRAIAQVRKFPHPALWAYGVILSWAAAIDCGFITQFGEALISGSPQPPRRPTIESILVLALVFANYESMAHSRAYIASRGWFQRAMASALALLLALSIVTWIVQGERALLGAHAADRAYLATARTFALVAVANLFAIARRWLPLPELGWIAYFLLGLGGIKLLAEDLPYGRAGTLVVGFALYGLSLIIVPKLTRQARSARAVQRAAAVTASSRRQPTAVANRESQGPSSMK